MSTLTPFDIDVLADERRGGNLPKMYDLKIQTNVRDKQGYLRNEKEFSSANANCSIINDGDKSLLKVEPLKESFSEKITLSIEGGGGISTMEYTVNHG